MTGKDKKLSLFTTIGRSDVFMEVPITNIHLKQCVSDHMVSICPYHWSLSFLNFMLPVGYCMRYA